MLFAWPSNHPSIHHRDSAQCLLLLLICDSIAPREISTFDSHDLTLPTFKYRSYFHCFIPSGLLS